MENLFALTYQGKSFNQRESDNYVNVGQMCANHGKAFKDWKKTKSATSYINALSANVNIVPLDLVQVREGNTGTWAHPLVAIEIGRWISPDFGVWCNQHIKHLLENGITEIHQKPGRVLSKRDAVDYIQAAKDLNSLPQGILKQLLNDALIDQINLEQNLKYLPVAEKPKQYTIVKVRAKMLGYTSEQVGDGKQLGKFIKKQIAPAFQEMVGRFPVYHYEITPELDYAIACYFS